MLSDKDHKWWGPSQSVLDFLDKEIAVGARVLEIGPGNTPFSRAETFVDLRENKSVPAHALTVRDVTEDKLPFRDGSFDFIYCRHVLEDIYNPFPLIAEMQRVGQAGYIETPSPIAELCRGVDGGSPSYRGYHHHRWIIWSDGTSLRFVSKYPSVEYVKIKEGVLETFLRIGPKYWNTHFMWSRDINCVHLDNGRDYVFWPGYAELLAVAIDESWLSSRQFWEDMKQEVRAA